MRQKWIVDSGAYNHIAQDKKCFNPNSYQTYNVDQSIQGAGGTFSVISTGNVKITAQALEGHYYDIMLLGILYCPIMFPNMLSVSCL